MLHIPRDLRLAQFNVNRLGTRAATIEASRDRAGSILSIVVYIPCGVKSRRSNTIIGIAVRFLFSPEVKYQARVTGTSRGPERLSAYLHSCLTMRSRYLGNSNALLRKSSWWSQWSRRTSSPTVSTSVGKDCIESDPHSMRFRRRCTQTGRP